MSEDDINSVNRRSVLRKTAIIGGVVVTPGVVSADESDRSIESDRTINGVPYTHAVEGKDYDAYETLLTDSDGNVTFENIDFDKAEIIVTQPSQQNLEIPDQSNRENSSERLPDQSVNVPKPDVYQGPPEGIKIFHGKYKNAESTIDPNKPESEQVSTLSLRTGRYTIFSVPNYVPGVGGCEFVMGYDADFQLFPAKYVDLSVGVGLCDRYIELAGVGVGYLSDEYFCLSPPRNLPVDVQGCLSVNWTSNDELEVSGGVSVAVPKNNPCSPAKCQIQRDFMVDWTIPTP